MPNLRISEEALEKIGREQARLRLEGLKLSKQDTLDRMLVEREEAQLNDFAPLAQTGGRDA